MVAPIVVALALWPLGPTPAHAGGPPDHLGTPPVFAYYYIWFDASSWDRAKTDYPLLGRYSSDERPVMRDHIQLAKRTGLDGFIVSWKSTPTLDERLANLVRIAADENFKLMVIYQGLDFERRPLPIDKVASDLDGFRRTFASSPVFDVFGGPTVIWSGTWEFSRREVASVTSSTRGLQVLASEHSASDYRRLAGLVAGNAYYWSSVNPETFPGYEEKLRSMSAAVHRDAGLWIAPAAPGFDARLIGGHTVVPRLEGETLRREYEAAVSSSPDAVGLISWNEFSENSHIEPSEREGTTSLEVLADLLDAKPPPTRGDLDSSEPATRGTGLWAISAIGGLLLVVAGGIVAVAWRRRVAPYDASNPWR
jgi:Glycosyl hydrolase family 71